MKKLLGIVGLSFVLFTGCGDTEEPKPNQNNCPTGFTGENCDQCADKHFTGPLCDQCVEGYYKDYYGHCTEYGQFTDSRDGNSYKTITHNEQTWMAQNLRYDGVEHYSANGDSLNDAKYGFLYTWENALKACPSGWHLPTVDEFRDLLSKTGGDDDGSKIRDKSWDNGSNSSGFSALPAGDRFKEDEFNYFGTLANFWSSTQYSKEYAYYILVDLLPQIIKDGDPATAYSVRCIKDSN